MNSFFNVGFFSSLLAVSRLLFGLLLSKLAAVYAGPGGLTLLAQLQNSITVANGISAASLTNGLIKFSAKYVDQKDCSASMFYWRASVLFSFLITLLVIIGALSFGLENASRAIFFSSEYTVLLVLVLSAQPFFSFLTLVISVSNGLQDYKKYFQISFLSSVLAGLVSVIVFLLLGFEYFLYSVALGPIFGAVSAYFTVKGTFWFKAAYWFGRTDFKSILGISSYVIMAITSAATVPVAQLLMRNILVELEGTSDAGIWQATIKLSQTYMAIITVSLSTFLLPRLSKASNSLSLQQELIGVLKIILPGFIVFGTALFFLKGWLFVVLFSKEFVRGGDYFTLQLMGDFIKTVSWVYAFPLVAIGATKWFIVSELLYSACYTLLGYFFVSQCGVEGAFLSYILAYIIYLLFVKFGLRKCYKSNYMEES